MLENEFASGVGKFIGFGDLKKSGVEGEEEKCKYKEYKNTVPILDHGDIIPYYLEEL